MLIKTGRAVGSLSHTLKYSGPRLPRGPMLTANLLGASHRVSDFSVADANYQNRTRLFEFTRLPPPTDRAFVEDQAEA